MQILLVAATELEIKPFITTNTNMDVLVTGVGVPSTIYHLQKRLHQVDYDLVIQAGIAGSFTDNIQPGEVVLVKQDSFGDLGIEEKGIFNTVFTSGFANENDFPFENGWLINPHELVQQSPVKAVTVNKVSDSETQKEQLIQTFDPAIESMEGAALHYTCLQENIPFIQIRSISNIVGERDKSKWKMKESITNLNATLINMIAQLKAIH